MTNVEAINELLFDKALYEDEYCHAGDGSPDGDLMQALDMAIEALKFGIEKEPIEDGICPHCGNDVVRDYNFCPECGQALKW